MTTADGQLDRVGERWQLRFERTLAHPPDKVWRALTEPEHQAAWFPDAMEGERVVGATLRFVSREMPDYPAFHGEILVFDPPNTLEFTWGEDTLRFELEPTPGGTLLRFLDTFYELGKAARDGAGWHVCLEQLVHSLDGEELPWKPEEHWQEVNAAYTEHLGPEASTLGPPQEWIDTHS